MNTVLRGVEEGWRENVYEIPSKTLVECAICTLCGNMYNQCDRSGTIGIEFSWADFVSIAPRIQECGALHTLYNE